jgi:cytochrome c oxidase assembly protein subunit 16
MGVFQNKKFRTSSQANTIASKYRSALARHPFALFGLPFIVTMVAGSFFLTPATAIRYEKHDRRVRQLSKEEELGIGKAGRKVDMKEEYYVGSNAMLRDGKHANKLAEIGSEGLGRLGTKAC